MFSRLSLTSLDKVVRQITANLIKTTAPPRDGRARSPAVRSLSAPAGSFLLSATDASSSPPRPSRAACGLAGRSPRPRTEKSIGRPGARVNGGAAPGLAKLREALHDEGFERREKHDALLLVRVRARYDRDRLLVGLAGCAGWNSASRLPL